MLHIDIWADFACPACYLAKPRIDQAIAASRHADAITVTYRSFELFPEAGPEPFDSFEHVLHKFGGDQAQAARLEEHMAALARAQGQPYAIHHPVASSFDAHRMLHLAAEHRAASEFMGAVQRDLLGEGVNVYTAAYLANAATRAGVPAARAEALWRVTSTPTPSARTRRPPGRQASSPSPSPSSADAWRSRAPRQPMPTPTRSPKPSPQETRSEPAQAHHPDRRHRRGLRPQDRHLHYPADANPVTRRGAGNRRGPSGHGGDPKRLTWPGPGSCPCQNSRTGSELAFLVLVRLLSGTR
ncbi:MAG TPA: DsbA family protein [Trebonia sp.]|nr:DsbA family protein [Trebonia sp.]